MAVWHLDREFNQVETHILMWNPAAGPAILTAINQRKSAVEDVWHQHAFSKAI